MSHELRSLFMELPTEVRENIYRYLFVASYTTTEHNMKSKEYDAKRVHLLEGSDRSYHFHTSIMWTNRMIYEESVSLFERENFFVCLTTSRPSHHFEKLSLRGMDMIVSGAKAQRFSYAAMTLTVNIPISDDLMVYRASDTADKNPWWACKYIFCSDELPTFCRLLLKSLGPKRSLQKLTIHIDIHNTWEQRSWEMDRSASGLSRLQKLLDPLRQLHNCGVAQIEGPLSASYKGNVIADLCKGRPTATDMVGTLKVLLDRGDEQVREGLHNDAINKFKTALNYVASYYWDFHDRLFTMDSGHFPFLTAQQTIGNLKVRLFARIASTYLQIGMTRMARIYVERALNPNHSLKDQYPKLIELDRRPWQKVVYAEVLYVSAQIWYAFGHVRNAIYDLREAQRHAELNEEQQRALDAWQRHGDRLSDRSTRKFEATEVQHQKEGLKHEERFLVACNWKKKGDRLLKGGRSELAISTYQRSLSKIGLLIQDLDCITTSSRTFGGYKIISSGTFEGYTIKDGIKSLEFKVVASIAASYLQSERYEVVIECTDGLLKCDFDSYEPSKCRYQAEYKHRCVYEDYERDWAKDQRLDYAKVYYCNSIALMRLGESVRALERMEKALELDPEDSAISAQLMILRRKAEKESS